MPTLKLKLKLKSSRMSTRTNRTPETIQRNKKGDASASSFLCFCQPNGIMACGPSNAEYDSKHVRFDFQLNRKASENIRLDPLRQRQQLLPGGLTIIDQHQRLQPMHPGIAGSGNFSRRIAQMAWLTSAAVGAVTPCSARR